jgi:hypothetical protein
MPWIGSQALSVSGASNSLCPDPLCSYRVSAFTFLHFDRNAIHTSVVDSGFVCHAFYPPSGQNTPQPTAFSDRFFGELSIDIATIPGACWRSRSRCTPMGTAAIVSRLGREFTW